MVKERLKKGSNYIYLTLAVIYFVLKIDENHYLQVFLKYCKYIGKEKK